jgi:hypothetical protein
MDPGVRRDDVLRLVVKNTVIRARAATTRLS